MLSYVSSLVLHTHWNTGTYFFLLLRILKKVQKRQLSVQKPFLRCPQQPPITLLGHRMPFSSLHIQVEHVHMCMHVQNENKPVKKEKKFFMFTVDISISPQALCFLLDFEMLNSSAEVGNWCSDIFSMTLLSNSRAGVKSDRLSDVYAPR